MSLMEKYQKAKASLMNESIEIGGALLVIAIIIGTIAIPVFIAVNTTGWGATNIIIWGTILTVSFAALIMLVIGRFRKEG